MGSRRVSETILALVVDACPERQVHPKRAHHTLARACAPAQPPQGKGDLRSSQQRPLHSRPSVGHQRPWAQAFQLLLNPPLLVPLPHQPPARPAASLVPDLSITPDPGSPLGRGSLSRAARTPRLPVKTPPGPRPPSWWRPGLRLASLACVPGSSCWFSLQPPVTEPPFLHRLLVLRSSGALPEDSRWAPSALDSPLQSLAPGMEPTHLINGLFPTNGGRAPQPGLSCPCSGPASPEGGWQRTRGSQTLHRASCGQFGCLGASPSTTLVKTRFALL